MELDDDQYPTEETLKEIEHWPNCYSELMERIQEIYPSYGRMEYREQDNMWFMATGGWSGCESIIGALRENFMFWINHWCLSKRGGYYEFQIER
jgi:hypothetical protein